MENPEQLTQYSGPRLWFIVRDTRGNQGSFIYSIPEPHHARASSSYVAATRHSQLKEGKSEDKSGLDACIPTCGLLLFHAFWKPKVNVIFYPHKQEQEFTTLPKAKATIERTLFGYDPYNEHFKVLCLTDEESSHLLLTFSLESHGRRPSWETIACKAHKTFHHHTESIYINGVLYYLAEVEESATIVCFDVRSETFRFIELDEDMSPGYQWHLVKYKDRLAAQEMFAWQEVYSASLGEEFVLWVLEEDDVGNQQWSKHTYILSSQWNELADGMKIIGMASTGEIVLTPFCVSRSSPFNVFFYNLETEIFKEVHIEGFEKDFESGTVQTVLGI